MCRSPGCSGTCAQGLMIAAWAIDRSADSGRSAGTTSVTSGRRHQTIFVVLSTGLGARPTTTGSSERSTAGSLALGFGLAVATERLEGAVVEHKTPGLASFGMWWRVRIGDSVSR